jgi:hypothetical protein
MTSIASAADNTLVPDFSLTAGGPFYRLLRGMRALPL